MKKAFAIVLLILGGILTCGAGAFVCTYLLTFIGSIYRWVPCVLLAAHVTGAVFLHRLYQRHGWLNKWQFWLCAGLPGALVGAFSLILFFVLKAHGFFSGFFGGFGELVTAFYMFVYSGAFFVILGIVLLIAHASSVKIRGNSSKKL